MSLILPSYQSGFAQRDYEPAYPSLWQGCVGAWAPLLGPTGLVLRDAAGKNDGVLTGGPTWDISGGRYALGFDGTNDYVETVRTDILPTGDTDKTVSLWFRTTTTVSTRQWLFYGGTEGGTNRFALELQDSKFAFNRNQSLVSHTGTITQNVWNHGVVVYKSGGNVSLTLNGKTENFTSITSTPGANVNRFGAFITGAFYLTGNIDDIRIYSKALNPNEIELLASRRGIAYEPKRTRKWYFRGFSPKKKLLEAKITSTVPGSYQTGYAPRDGEPVYPELWRGCVGAWSAGLGPSNILRDNSPAKNHGSLVGGPKYKTSFGQYALEFNETGARDQVDVGNVCYMPNSFSVSFYVNLLVALGNDSAFANLWAVTRWNTGGSPGTNEFACLLRNANTGRDNTPSFVIEIGSQTYAVVSSRALSANRFAHVCCVRTESAIQIYIDGVLAGETATPSTAITNRNRNLKFADADISTDQMAQIQLDDIRIYDRALSPNEIKLLASQRNIAYAHRKKNIAFRAYDPIKQVGVGKITSIIPGGYHTGVGGVNNEPAYPELTKGLVGGWCPSLGVTGGLLRDNSGQGNHGVLTGMDPGTDWVVSGGKYALDFDGSNDWINTNQSSLYNFTATNSKFTIALWALDRSANRFSAAIAKNLNGGSADGGFMLTLSQDSTATDQNKGHFFLAFSAGNYTGVNFDFPQNEWRHVVIVVDMTLSGTSRVEAFVNGIKTGTKFSLGSGTSVGTNTRSLAIGADSAGNYGHDGILDDARIYNRVLSESEIRLLASRRGIGYDFKTHRSYSKTQSSGLLKRLILTGQT